MPREGAFFFKEGDLAKKMRKESVSGRWRSSSLVRNEMMAEADKQAEQKETELSASTLPGLD